MRYAVIYEETATGYSAYAPDLPGCGAAGRSLEETKKLIAKAIEGHIELLQEKGENVPKPPVGKRTSRICRPTTRTKQAGTER
jgi:predicted RNase H-like HicB family nuclease